LHKNGRQAVNLLGVKDRVALHKRNFDFHVCAVVVGAGLGERVGINDKRTFLAFAHLINALKPRR
jgi:hypothetical protein